MGTIWEL